MRHRQTGIRPPRPGRVVARGGVFSDAALDAADGRLWIHEPVLGDPCTPRYGTQRRWIERLSLVLGLSPGLSEQTAEKISRHLNVPTLEHRARRACFGAAEGSRARGQALMALMDQIQLQPPVWPHLLVAGFLGGAWTRPRFLRGEAGKVSSGSHSAGPARGPPS